MRDVDKLINSIFRGSKKLLFIFSEGVFAAGPAYKYFYNDPIVIEDSPPPIVTDPNVIDLCDSLEHEDVDPVWGKKFQRSPFVPQKKKLISVGHVTLSDSDDSDEEIEIAISRKSSPTIRKDKSAIVNAIFDDSTDDEVSPIRPRTKTPINHAPRFLPKPLVHSSTTDRFDPPCFKDSSIGDSVKDNPVFSDLSSEEDNSSTRKRVNRAAKLSVSARAKNSAKSSSSDEDSEPSGRIFRPGATLTPAACAKLQSKKRAFSSDGSSDDQPRKRTNIRGFRQPVILDKSSVGIRKTLDPIIQKAKDDYELSRKDMAREEIIQLEMNEAKEKYRRMSDDQLVAVGRDFGLGSTTNVLKTKAKREQYIDHLARISVYPFM